MAPPLVIHIIYRLGTGGMENGLVNLINFMPPERYRHVIVCLTRDSDFRKRITREDVPVIALHKRDGQDYSIYPRLWKLFKQLRPAIVHSRNISGMEYLAAAAMARVPGRIHGEHGLDMLELEGRNRKYNLLRRAVSPVVDRYIAVSRDLAKWLTASVGIRPNKLAQIYNGVDTRRFRPRDPARAPLGPEGFTPPGTMVVGTVGRLEPVKDQLTLVRAFLHLRDSDGVARDRLRLVIVGEGSLREKALGMLRDAQAEPFAWLPGELDDIPEVMRGLDLFVLPSLREGISNTVLEAMASGLPVVATKVGGNPELVVEGETGMLVPPDDPVGFSEAIRFYLRHPGESTRHGLAGRGRAEARFSMDAMVGGYLSVYDSVLRAKGCAA